MSKNRPNGPCSFCGKTQDQVQHFIGGPESLYTGSISICSECVSRFAGKRDVRCSFCGKARSQTRYFRHGPGRVGICNKCLALAQQIIAEKEVVTTNPAPPGSVEDDTIPSWSVLQSVTHYLDCVLHRVLFRLLFPTSDILPRSC